MTILLDAALERVVALEKEALAALTPAVTCDAVPYFFHWQDSFPYWTNRIGPGTVDDGILDVGDEDHDQIDVRIIMRLVIGHSTQDNRGVNEEHLKVWIPQVVRYFNDRPGLQHVGATTHLRDLWWAKVTNFTGFALLQSTGLGSITQVGCEFTLTCRFMDDVNLAYV